MITRRCTRPTTNHLCFPCTLLWGCAHRDPTPVLATASARGVGCVAFAFGGTTVAVIATTAGLKALTASAASPAVTQLIEHAASERGAAVEVQDVAAAPAAPPVRV